jgi:nicotinamidase-related amidase
MDHESTALVDASYEPLTRDNAAFLLIDHQVGPLWDTRFDEPRRRVAQLARAAHRLGVPTIVTTIAPDILGPVIPELRLARPGSARIVRTTPNPWRDPAIRRVLDALRRSKLIVAGSSELRVALSASGAVRDGYDVYAPVDASGPCTPRSLERLEQAGAIISTVSLVTRELTASGRDLRWAVATRGVASAWRPRFPPPQLAGA